VRQGKEIERLRSRLAAAEGELKLKDPERLLNYWQLYPETTKGTPEYVDPLTGSLLNAVHDAVTGKDTPRRHGGYVKYEDYERVREALQPFVEAQAFDEPSEHIYARDLELAREAIECETILPQVWCNSCRILHSPADCPAYAESEKGGA
jgi:hypothetical protein